MFNNFDICEGNRNVWTIWKCWNPDAFGIKSPSIQINDEANYLYIYTEGNIISFLTLQEIKDEFSDFDMEQDFSNILRLAPGESWTADNMNIYVRLK